MHLKFIPNTVVGYCGKWKWLQTLKCNDIYHWEIYCVLSFLLCLWLFPMGFPIWCSLETMKSYMTVLPHCSHILWRIYESHGNTIFAFLMIELPNNARLHIQHIRNHCSIVQSNYLISIINLFYTFHVAIVYIAFGVSYILVLFIFINSTYSWNLKRFLRSLLWR